MHADLTKGRQTLLNLPGNAAPFTEEGTGRPLRTHHVGDGRLRVYGELGRKPAWGRTPVIRRRLFVASTSRKKTRTRPPTARRRRAGAVACTSPSRPRGSSGCRVGRLSAVTGPGDNVLQKDADKAIPLAAPSLSGAGRGQWPSPWPTPAPPYPRRCAGGWESRPLPPAGMGIGLGLSIIRYGILQRHHGTFAVGRQPRHHVRLTSGSRWTLTGRGRPIERAFGSPVRIHRRQGI
jgi:hypothetical protein